MKYCLINSVYGVRSTGKIIAKQCRELMAEGHECLAVYGREASEDEVPKYRIGTKWDVYCHAALSRVLDNSGFLSKRATAALLVRLEAYRPDVIWLHNLHGYYINLPMLFAWLKQHPEIKKYWTLHDCWSFTGHCAHFVMKGCGKWKTGCEQCSQLRTYPACYGLDRSSTNYREKRTAFTGVENLTLITPSQWLANLVSESFLQEYPVQVIHNTIDTEIFKPTPGTFKAEYGLEGKCMVLGVAVGWDRAKGYDDFLQLRRLLSEEYVIVLVGVTLQQQKRLPAGILGIERTADQLQLAEIYSAADIFLNPSRQETFGLTTLEALSCGTPAVVYNSTACEEVANQYGGTIVEAGAVEALAREVCLLWQKNGHLHHG